MDNVTWNIVKPRAFFVHFALQLQEFKILSLQGPDFPGSLLM